MPTYGDGTENKHNGTVNSGAKSHNTPVWHVVDFSYGLTGQIAANLDVGSTLSSWQCKSLTPLRLQHRQEESICRQWRIGGCHRERLHAPLRHNLPHPHLCLSDGTRASDASRSVKTVLTGTVDRSSSRWPGPQAGSSEARRSEVRPEESGPS